MLLDVDGKENTSSRGPGLESGAGGGASAVVRQRVKHWLTTSLHIPSQIGYLEH
jgi:hypothetical protein